MQFCATQDASVFDEINSEDTNIKIDSEFMSIFNNEADTEEHLWLSEIINSIEYANTGHENLYYSPNLVKTLKSIFSRIPLWSNIMNAIFNSKNTTATSSDIESYFKSIKHLVYGENSLICVDSFIKQ